MAAMETKQWQDFSKAGGEEGEWQGVRHGPGASGTGEGLGSFMGAGREEKSSDHSQAGSGGFWGWQGES